MALTEQPPHDQDEPDELPVLIDIRRPSIDGQFLQRTAIQLFGQEHWRQQLVRRITEFEEPSLPANIVDDIIDALLAREWQAASLADDVLIFGPLIGYPHIEAPHLLHFTTLIYFILGHSIPGVPDEESH